MLFQEYGGYISDITRSWPVSGKFSDAERELYEAILSVQRSSLSLCRESANLSLDKIHEVTENGLRDQLKQLGFDLSGNVRFSMSRRPYSSHSSSVRQWRYYSHIMLDTTLGLTFMIVQDIREQVL
jgi:Xaa-Pro aminopeptidase